MTVTRIPAAPCSHRAARRYIRAANRRLRVRHVMVNATGVEGEIVEVRDTRGMTNILRFVVALPGRDRPTILYRDEFRLVTSR